MCVRKYYFEYYIWSRSIYAEPEACNFNPERDASPKQMGKFPKDFIWSVATGKLKKKSEGPGFKAQ